MILLSSAILVQYIRYFRKSLSTVHFGELFALKQWISSLLKHDTVPGVNNWCRFYVKTYCNMGMVKIVYENLPKASYFCKSPANIASDV